MTLIPRRIRMDFQDATSGDHPWRGMTSLLVMKVTTTFYRRMLMLACLIDEAPAPPTAPAGLELVLLDDGHMDAYLELRPDQSAREIEMRWRRDCACFAVFRDGVVAHAAWATMGRARVDYLGGDLLLANDDVYEFDGYTHRDYRGQGLFWLRNAFARRHYREWGARRMMGAVAVENATSMHAMELVGYHAIGLYGCWRLGPWQQDWAQAFGDEFLPPVERPE